MTFSVDIPENADCDKMYQNMEGMQDMQDYQEKCINQTPDLVHIYVNSTQTNYDVSYGPATQLNNTIIPMENLTAPIFNTPENINPIVNESLSEPLQLSDVPIVNDTGADQTPNNETVNQTAGN